MRRNPAWGGAFFRKAEELVQRMLPESRIAVLAGQQFAGTNTAPGLFTREVRALFRS
jgi:hypothetical protein